MNLPSIEKKHKIPPGSVFFLTNCFKPSQFLQWLAPEPSASQSLCLEVSLGPRSTPSPPELIPGSGNGSSKKSQLWKRENHLPRLPFKGIIAPIYVSFPGNYLEGSQKEPTPHWQKLHLLKTLPPPAPFRNVVSLCRSDPRSSSAYTEKRHRQHGPGMVVVCFRQVVNISAKNCMSMSSCPISSLNDG